MARVSKKKELLDHMIREEIVTTLLDLISRDKAVTMDAIAAECGVAKGTLYNYFKNKRELINYVHQTMITPIKEANRTIFDSDKPLRDQLHEFVKAVFGFQKAYPLYFRFIQSQRTAYEADRERFEFVILPLMKLCSKGMQKGEFVKSDPYVMASMIYGTVIGPLQNLKEREKEHPKLETIKKDIICLLDRMMLK